MNETQELIPIGEAARRAGVTTRTIRYYEELGLISPVREGGRRSRHFSEFHVKLIGDIQQLSSLGFTLEEIKQVMALKRVFFDESGRERAWRRREVPLNGAALEALEEKTSAVMENIRSQAEFLSRVSEFLNRFTGRTQR
jgi:DNA-binding transcriptional MerR regulator